MCTWMKVLFTRKDSKEDNAKTMKLLATLERFNVFSEEKTATLKNIATKNLATVSIEDSLFNASASGQSQLFVEECLGDTFRKPLPKNFPLTFASLYELGRTRGSVTKLYRLVTAYESGRQVNIQDVLKYELMPVPVSLVEMNKCLRSGNKSVLAELVTTDVNCPTSITLEGTSGLIIDGQALVVAIGKPEQAKHLVTCVIYLLALFLGKALVMQE